ncbi:hypothetical protein KC353_g35 [Hortaea werneckii]|nr:hypothetical protein KC353_g35 [Hortaea werneckii]
MKWTDGGVGTKDSKKVVKNLIRSFILRVPALANDDIDCRFLTQIGRVSSLTKSCLYQLAMIIWYSSVPKAKISVRGTWSPSRRCHRLGITALGDPRPLRTIWRLGRCCERECRSGCMTSNPSSERAGISTRFDHRP